MHPNTFLDIVKQEGGLRNRDEAERATRIVFDLLHHRITEEEAQDVRSQLPEQLANLWEGGTTWMEWLFSKLAPHHTYTRQEFIDEVNARKGDIMATGEQIVRAVFYALQSQISPGEARDVAAQLPRDLKQLWDESRPLEQIQAAGGPEYESVGMGAELKKHDIHEEIP